MINWHEQQLLLHYITNDVIIPDHLIGPDADTARRWILSYRYQYGQAPSTDLFCEKFDVARRDHLEPYDELIEGLKVNKARTGLIKIQEEILGATGKNPLETLEQLKQQVADLTDQLTVSRSVLKFTEYEEVFKEYAKARAEGRLPRVANFGFPTLDEQMNGIEQGDLIVLYARYSHGKSQLGCKFAVNAFRQNKRVLYFVLEEDPKLRMKIVQALFAETDSRPYTRMTLENGDWQDFKAKVRLASGYTGDIIVPEKPVTTITEILAYLAEYKPDYFILDQLTNFASSMEWKDMSQAIYRINNEVCLQTMIPGIVLTQASKKGDIGFADAIGQAASKVMKLSPPPMEVTEHKHIEVVKNRRGAGGGEINLVWELEKGKIEEVAYKPVNVFEKKKQLEDDGDDLQWS